MTSQRRAVIGLDIGGTATRGLRAEGPPGRPGPRLDVVARSASGSANLQNVSEATAAAHLRAVLDGLDCASLPEDTVVAIGSGGVDTDRDVERLRRLVCAVAPVGRWPLRIVHDTRLILAAAGLDTGIAVIAGTGSVAWGRDAAGREERRGGWGHLLGDEGSGWWLGREAVRRALSRAEAGLPVDDLDDAVLAARQMTSRHDLIADFHAAPERTAWAGLAAEVDRCAAQGHEGSLHLLRQAARELTRLAADVGRQLQLEGPVVVGGGLTGSPALCRALEEAARAHGLGDLRILDEPPVHGTLHLADAVTDATGGPAPA